MNSINLTGNICKDLEVKMTPSGKSVIQLTLAVKRPFATDVTDFIPLAVWNQTAEYLGKYAKKGSKIAVSGKLTTRKYQDKDGNNRTAFEVVCDAVEILDSKTSNDQTPSGQQPTFATPQTPQFMEVTEDDDVPF